MNTKKQDKISETLLAAIITISVIGFGNPNIFLETNKNNYINKNIYMQRNLTMIIVTALIFSSVFSFFVALCVQENENKRKSIWNTIGTVLFVFAIILSGLFWMFK